MLLSFLIEPSLRARYRQDALGNVAGTVLNLTLQTFVSVVELRAGAPAKVVSANIAILFIPSFLAALLPVVCRYISLGYTILLLRLLAGVSLLPCLLAPSLGTLMVGYILAIILINLADIAYPALLRKLYPTHTHGGILGVLYTERSLITALFILAFGFLLKDSNPATSIRLVGFLSLFGVLAGIGSWPFRHQREAPTNATEREVTAIATLKDPAFLRYLFTVTIFGIGISMFLVLWPLIQVKALEFSNSQVGMLGSVTFLAQMAAYLWFSRRGQVNSGLRQIAMPFALIGTPMVAFLFLSLPAMKILPAFWIMLLAVTTWNIGGGLWTVYYYLLVNRLAGSSSALAYQGMQGTVIGARGMIVPFVALALYQHLGLTAAVLITGLFVFAGALIAYLQPTLPTKS